MAGIIDFPTVVQEALRHFGDLLPNEPQRRHFAEYLTGLFVAERKSVCGINREFAQTTDQSCLNRFLTAAEWDVQALNQRRLDLLQKDPSTRYSDQGVLPIDNTLVDRDGMLIPDAGWFWDHAEERNKIAQDDLFVNYVGTSGKHYPLEFRLFRKQEICEALKQPFRNHTALCCELIDWVCERGIPGDFTMDCSFTGAEVLNHIDGKKDRFGRPRGYVGDLKANRKLEWKGRVLKASELAASIPAAPPRDPGGVLPRHADHGPRRIHRRPARYAAQRPGLRATRWPSRPGRLPSSPRPGPVRDRQPCAVAMADQAVPPRRGHHGAPAAA